MVVIFLHELDEELHFHRDLIIEENVRAGTTSPGGVPSRFAKIICSTFQGIEMIRQ